MNKIFALLAFVFCVTAGAHTSVQEWQAKAVEKYPALGVQDSAFNKAFVAEYERQKQAFPERFREPGWPMRIADVVAFELRMSTANASSTRGPSGAQTPAPPRGFVDEAMIPPPKGFVDEIAPPPGFVPDGGSVSANVKGKPPFDPSKPFAVVEKSAAAPASPPQTMPKPKFDPNTAVEEPSGFDPATAHPVLTDADFTPKDVTHPASASGPAGGSPKWADPFDFEVITPNTPPAAKRATMLRWVGLTAVALTLVGLIVWGVKILARSGRIARLLPALRISFDRHLTTGAILTATVILLLASWVYPPGFHLPRGTSSLPTRGWFFLFDTLSIMQVDFGRLILLDAIIAVVGLSLARVASGNSPSRALVVRAAFYSLVALPVLALICGAVFSSSRAISQAASWANQPRKNAPTVRKPNPFDQFDQSTAVPSPSWEPPEVRTSKYDAFFADLPVTQPKQNSKPFDPDAFLKEKPSGVTFLDEPDANDLTKITLSDVGATQYRFSITGFHGRIRNGLSRSIDNVVLKASLLRPNGEVVEVRRYKAKYWVTSTWRETYFPDEPASFTITDTISNLPEGVTWKFEVVEALYAK